MLYNPEATMKRGAAMKKHAILARNRDGVRNYWRSGGYLSRSEIGDASGS